MARKYDYKRFSGNDSVSAVCDWINKNLTEKDHVISITHEDCPTGTVKYVYYYTDDTNRQK